LSWIEKILSKDAAPLDNLFEKKEKVEEYKPSQSTFPIGGGGLGIF